MLRDVTKVFTVQVFTVQVFTVQVFAVQVFCEVSIPRTLTPYASQSANGWHYTH